MKKLYFLLASFVFMMIFPVNIIADINFYENYPWPKVTEESQDIAYEAPISKFYGKWIYLNYKNPEGNVWIINANGTWESQTVSSSQYNGIKLLSIMKGTWKKKGNTLTVTLNVSPYNCVVAPESKTDYANLSARKKEEVQTKIKNDIKSVNDYLNGINRNAEYYISYIDDYIITLRNEGQLVKASKYPELLKEFEEKGAKEKAEKLAAQQKAEEEKISRGNNKTNEEIFITVEQPAEFPGGQSALMKWLSNNMHYPEAAKQNDIQGRVIVTFVVEKDGTIGDAKVSRSVDPDLDREALRLVKKMPAWQPGKNEGVAVASYFNLPITFRLQ